MEGFFRKLANYRMQLTALTCHGSGKGLRQAAGASDFQPEPRQAIPQLMRRLLGCRSEIT